MSGRASSVLQDSPPVRAGGRFVARRRLRRRRALIAILVLLLLFCAGIIYGIRQSVVRISHIDIFGADQSFAEIAFREMQGNYLGIIPRDSTLFFSGSRIRENIIAAHSDIAAVSIFRNGLTGLSIKMNNRVPVARWCGSVNPQQAVFALSTDCYFFDANGFVYATTSAERPLNSFIVYGSLTNGDSPVGSTLMNAEKFPAAFDFARQLIMFGSHVSSVVFRNDEVDDHLESGTRITYVLGDEQNAFTALASARDNFNLADGSIEYIDLRFGRKVYLKKKK